MAKLILKVNYYKPGRAKSMGGYAKYIATRENVEKPHDVTLQMDMTEKQAEIIEKLKKDFPNSFHSEEYLAYLSSPTRENASEYITRTLEDNLPHIVDSPTYADYIAIAVRDDKLFTKQWQCGIPVPTEKQRQRYIKTMAYQKNNRTIAEEEGCSHQMISKSISKAQEIIDEEKKKRGY